MRFEITSVSIFLLSDTVTNMNLGDVMEEYNPGEEIICAAEGNPEPHIRWVDDMNNTVVDSATLTIHASMVGTRTYSCLATNTVRGANYSLTETITFNVTSKFSCFFFHHCH